MDIHNNQKKIAVINDLTGFGRCSVAVAMPVISKMKIQCCWLPTAILSNQTGFPSYFMDDYTKHFTEYADEWKKLHLQFQGIETGFLGSTEQARLVRHFIRDFRRDDTIVLVDPVMGDNGHIYPSYDEEHCNAIRKLVRMATIITPNLTEACILTNTPYHDAPWSETEFQQLLDKLSALGPKKIVITGIPCGDDILDFSYVDGQMKMHKLPRIGGSRNGTGDLFASIIIADAVNGVDFQESVVKASSFIRACITRSIEMGIPAIRVCFSRQIPVRIRAHPRGAFNSVGACTPTELNRPLKCSLSDAYVLQLIDFIPLPTRKESSCREKKKSYIKFITISM